MLFSDALISLLEGNYLTREIWKDKNEYCVVMPGMQYIWKILTSPTPNAGNHVLSIDDLLAEDWQAYGQPIDLAVGEYNPTITAEVA